jgi:septal ring factor EnvC (AmiA/AmiB activator)
MMDEERDTSHTESGHTGITETSSAPRTSGWLIAAVVVLLVGLCVAVAHSYAQAKVSDQNASKAAQMSATIGQLQGQLDSLNAKLNSLSAPPVVTHEAAPAEQAAHRAANRAAARRRIAAENKRYKQLQSQLADQQQQLKATQDQLAQDRSDLEGNISSTRDQLNGSIAKTHDELVALEQKGERNYYEFDLTKSKRFAHEGPVLLSLRKADTKHKRYNLSMIVDDNQMEKKNVNLYEPVWIDGGDSQEVQVVVNKIEKNHIHGYVSAPKYNQSASLTPAAAHTDSNGNAASTASSSGSGANDNSSGTTQQPTQ